MAFRYPPPYFDKLNEHMTPSPVVDFSNPPPMFRPTYTSDAFQYHPQQQQQPPPPLPTLSQSSSWSQETSLHFTGSNSVQPVEVLPTKVTPHVSDWLQDWLGGKRFHKKQSNKGGTSQALKVFEVRQMLQKSMNNLKKLHKLQENLTSNYQELESSLWKEKWDQVKDLRVQIGDCLNKLDNPSTLSAVRRLLVKRNKKRKREKRKRLEHKEMTAEFRARRQQMHENIDKWLNDMQEVVERAKREESLKHEADQVLSEVTHRKAEARRQLNMLKALQKLRTIRIQTATQRGQHVDAESGIRFTRVVEHLLKLWEDQMKEYEIEEQGLRVMLEEAVEERTKSEVSQIKQNLQQWEMLLFGKRGPYNDFYQAAEQNVESFIAVRNSWDKFLAPPGAVMSSSIPVGWVLPSHPSSEKWESLLTKDKKNV